MLRMIALLVLTGCDESGKDTASTETLPECAALDEDACTAREGCMPLSAWSCAKPAGDRAFVGCIADPGGCDDAISYGAAPDAPDACWRFSDTCQPDGWQACADAGECEAR